MEPSIKNENCESNEPKRRRDRTGRLERDLRRWQRKRATIDKFKEEKFGLPNTDSGIDMSAHNLGR